MSYQEKKNIVNIAAMGLLLAAYSLYALGRYRSGAIPADDLGAWAGMMLIFIGIGIVATIIIQIAFHVSFSVSIAVKKKLQDENCEENEIEKTIHTEMAEDEMEKLIELKAARAGYIFAGCGFAAGLVLLVLEILPVVMLNTLFLAISGASLVEGFARLYFYRKGLAHG